MSERIKANVKLEAIERLREILKPGDTVYCILRSVSRSGMSRRIDFYALQDGQHRYLSGYISNTLGLQFPKHGQQGLRVNGCGMDMGFHVVYELSHKLFRGAECVCIGEGCPSNDHNNGDRNYSPHPHNDAGYMLRREWL